MSDRETRHLDELGHPDHGPWHPVWDDDADPLGDAASLALEALADSSPSATANPPTVPTRPTNQPKDPTMNYIVQHQRTSNDTNGNPRRLWVIYRDSAPHPTRYAVTYRVVDEGYDVSTAAQAMKVAGLDGLPHLIMPDVDITPAEYRHGLLTGERTNDQNPWRIRWAEDGSEDQIYCYAATRTHAKRFAGEYNYPYRNTDRPVRVVAEPNG